MATQPSYNISPKLRFQSSADNVSKHHKMIESPEFERACDFTIRHMAWLLSQEKTDFNGKAANQIKMDGIHEFLALFRNLGLQPQPLPTRVDSDNLIQLK